MYGPDPGDASVEHTYLRVREEIQRGIAAMRAYPNEGPREKERFLANAIAPRSRTLRALLTVILALYRVGRRTGEAGSQQGTGMIRGSTEVNSRNATVPPGNNGTPPSHRTGPETGRERRNGSSAARNDQPMPEDEMPDMPDGRRDARRGGCPKETGSIGLSEFINIYKDAIARTVTEAYAPRYRPGEPGQDQPLPRLIRRPMGAQEHAIRGAALSLEVNPGTIIVGEMGTGKTYIGAAAAHMNGHQNVLVLCPPHLVPKWKREIEMTVPGARTAIVRTITDLQRLSEPTRDGGPRFTIMSRETAKLSYRWEPAYVTRLPAKSQCEENELLPGMLPADLGQGRHPRPAQGADEESA